MKKIKIVKDTKTNEKLLKRKKNNIVIYGYNFFDEDIYYLSFSGKNMNIVINRIDDLKMFEKIFFKLLDFKFEFTRKGLYDEKHNFNEIIFLYKNTKELLNYVENQSTFKRRLCFDFNPKNYL
jgi:glycerophosphoryl diester phosphodiesterase